MTRRLVFAVDLDRDVNIPIEGRPEAGSADRGSGAGPRFSSSERGLELILELLDDLGIKATFFVEGRTSEMFDCSGIRGHCIGFHGYDHEDLTSLADPGKAMSKGFQAVSDNISRPVCFRAPYMKSDERVLSELVSLGIRHDSSVYADPEVQPYERNGITEHPVAKGRDGNGRTIAAYLWPMHEGKRSFGDYSSLITGQDDQDIVLSTHSWHIVERRDSGIMEEEEIMVNLDNVKAVIEMFMDEGFVPSVLTGRSHGYQIQGFQGRGHRAPLPDAGG